MTAEEYIEQGFKVGLQGDHVAALAAFEQAIALDRNFPEVWGNLCSLLTAQPQLRDATSFAPETGLCRWVYLISRKPFLSEKDIRFTARAFRETSWFPLLARRFLSERISSAWDTLLADGFNDALLSECDVPDATLLALKTCPGLTDADRLIWMGTIQLTFGDPMEAFRLLNEADSLDESDLRGQFFLLQALAAYRESG